MTPEGFNKKLRSEKLRAEFSGSESIISEVLWPAECHIFQEKHSELVRHFVRVPGGCLTN